MQQVQQPDIGGVGDPTRDLERRFGARQRASDEGQRAHATLLAERRASVAKARLIAERACGTL